MTTLGQRLLAAVRANRTPSDEWEPFPEYEDADEFPDDPDNWTDEADE